MQPGQPAAIEELMTQLPIGLVENFYGALLYETLDVVNEKRQSVKQLKRQRYDHARDAKQYTSQKEQLLQ